MRNSQPERQGTRRTWIRQLCGQTNRRDPWRNSGNRCHRSLLSFPFPPECAEPPPVKASPARMSMAVRLQHTVCCLLHCHLHGHNRLRRAETDSSSFTIMLSPAAVSVCDRGAARAAFPFVPAATNRTDGYAKANSSQPVCFSFLVRETSQCNYTCKNDVTLL